MYVPTSYRPGSRVPLTYDLFIHSGGEHLAFAIQDRFSDAVSALGSPVRATRSGAFTYRWYPSLDSTPLGIAPPATTG